MCADEPCHHGRYGVCGECLQNEYACGPWVPWSKYVADASAKVARNVKALPVEFVAKVFAHGRSMQGRRGWMPAQPINAGRGHVILA